MKLVELHDSEHYRALELRPQIQARREFGLDINLNDDGGEQSRAVRVACDNSESC